MGYPKMSSFHLIFDIECLRIQKKVESMICCAIGMAKILSNDCMDYCVYIRIICMFAGLYVIAILEQMYITAIVSYYFYFTHYALLLCHCLLLHHFNIQTYH